MNKVILSGRATKDPDVRYNAEGLAIARFSMAVDRVKDGADFPNIVAFGKSAEFAEKYIKKGTKILTEGRIQTGSYSREDGSKVYTTDVIADRFEFCEKKGDNPLANINADVQINDDDFMNIPEGLDAELPFN